MSELYTVNTFDLSRRSPQRNATATLRKINLKEVSHRVWKHLGARTPQLTQFAYVDMMEGHAEVIRVLMGRVSSDIGDPPSAYTHSRAENFSLSCVAVFKKKAA